MQRTLFAENVGNIGVEPGFYSALGVARRRGDVEPDDYLMHDVADRLANRVQLTTDGLRAYLDAVEDVFVGDVDCPAQITV